MTASNEPSKRVKCLVVRSGRQEASTRDVVGEEPLRVLVNGEAVATMMRTPGNETDLATGFLLSFLELVPGLKTTPIYAQVIVIALFMVILKVRGNRLLEAGKV